MKVLFITTSYPPYFDMQTIRNDKLIQGLIKAGHNVTVLSPSASENKESELIINESLEEWKTTQPVFFKIRDFLDSKVKINFFIKLLNVFGGMVLFPDTYAMWSFNCMRFLKNKEIELFDLIVTSSGSFTSHIVASKLTKKYNIKWAAEYGDPWSIDKYGKEKKMLRNYERKILNKANLLFFTTNETIEAYNKFLSKYNLNKKLVYLPCGFDKIKYSNEISKKKKELVYTGVAYSNDRDLTNSILAVKEFENRLNLKIVGSYSSKYENIEGIRKIVSFKGQVSYGESLKIINSSFALLHIGNFGTMQIPGKTYIYLATPKPIIYILQEEKNDPTHNLLKKFKGIIFVENTKQSIELGIIELLENYNFYLEESKFRLESPLLQEFSWSNIGDVFSNELEALVNK